MAAERVDKKYTAGVKQEDTYSDFFVNFNAHPNTGFLLKRTDIEAVKRSIRNLLSTEQGERIYNENYGSRIRSLLFELPTSINKEQLKSSIESAIENYEPRADLKEVVVGLSNDETTYVIDVYFSVINNPNLQNLQIKMDRVR
jgi:phage baseplate assembly protein W